MTNKTNEKKVYRETLENLREIRDGIHLSRGGPNRLYTAEYKQAGEKIYTKYKGEIDSFCTVAPAYAVYGATILSAIGAIGGIAAYLATKNSEPMNCYPLLCLPGSLVGGIIGGFCGFIADTINKNTLVKKIMADKEIVIPKKRLGEYSV